LECSDLIQDSTPVALGPAVVASHSFSQMAFPQCCARLPHQLTLPSLFDEGYIFNVSPQAPTLKWPVRPGFRLDSFLCLFEAPITNCPTAACICAAHVHSRSITCSTTASVQKANTVAYLWNAADVFSVTTGVSSGTERHADGAASWDTKAKRSSSDILTMLGRQHGHMTRSWWSCGAQEVRQPQHQPAGRPSTVHTMTAYAFVHPLACLW
jgi:hypothetical protein